MLRDIICSPIMHKVYKGLFIALIFLRSFSLVIFVHYDSKCLIIEHSSALACEQDGLVPNSERLMFAWLLSTIASAVVFVLIVVGDEDSLFEFSTASSACKKGSFWSLSILLLLTVIYYIVRVAESPSKSKHISVALIFWPIAMFLVVVCLNYTPQEPCPAICLCLRNCLLTTSCERFERCEPCPRSCCECCTKYELPESCPENCCECCSQLRRQNHPATQKIWRCIFYWISLILFFVEVACIWLAVALDAAYDVAPLMEGLHRDEKWGGIVVLLLGFRITFHTRLLTFFWQKIFHGDKDLFSEPGSKISGCGKKLCAGKPRDDGGHEDQVEDDENDGDQVETGESSSKAMRSAKPARPPQPEKFTETRPAYHSKAEKVSI